MASASPQLELPPIVREQLAHIRRGIRRYVWLQGLAALVLTLGAAFWVGLLVDWQFEPRPAIRLAAMIAIAAIGLWVTYRYLLRRAFVRLADNSLAVLLERHFPELKDHVVTAVDLAVTRERDVPYHPELIERTHRAAADAIADVRVGEIFRRGPLVRGLLAATVCVVSIPIFALLAHEAFGFWMQRLALSTEAWPRRVHLEVVGFPANAEGQRTHKLAQDDDFELLVRAEAGEHRIPDEVEIRYRLSDGRRGRDSMIRVGEAVPGRDEFQLYRYQFKHVAADMTLDVVGGDDRVRGLHLQIVDRPELVGMEVECEYPQYLNRPSRRLPVTGGMRIPEGTRLTLHANSTKPLTEVKIHRAHESQEILQPNDGAPQQEFNWNYGTLSADDVLTIQLTDTDGVTGREPYRVSLSVVPDELPQIAVRLDGIGNAVTPDAILPLAGKITDDNGLDKVWFAFRVDNGPSGERLFAHQPYGAQSQLEMDAFDLRATVRANGRPVLQLKPGETLYLSVRATDRYDLSDATRAGSSQQFALDVVTVAQLLALMERRELELRQRFEAIVSKMTDTRNLLARIDFTEGSASATEDKTPGESAAAESSAAAPADPAERALSRRRFRVAGSLQNVTQSAHEVLGVAESFDDIYKQIENNRIDNPDLKSRLRDQIAVPLRQLGETRMTELESQLQLVEQRIADAQSGPPVLATAIKQTDDILVQMQSVLNRMLELESYNEVVALLRGIIHDQGELNRKTKEQQTQRLQNFFEQ